jgi:4-hydroxybenzoate polyprenyltransferase
MPTPIVPDSEHARVGRLPPFFRDLVQLARIDRPIGAWLLFWPGAWAIALAGQAIARVELLLWFALGAVAMRSAGCVYNDIVDRELDARVARTRDRPLASGRVSLRTAWLLLAGLCLVGLVVLLQLDHLAQLVAIASLALVAAYPFMKRITWWPQAWLGLVFSWAAPVGWAAVTGTVDPALAWLYGGTVLWVSGYDTIYALQDLEDDALAGVKSSARALGGNVRLGVALFYAGAAAAWGAAVWTVRPDPIALLALAPAIAHLFWQAAGLHVGDASDALMRFRANRTTGLLVFLGLLAVGTASRGAH